MRAQAAQQKIYLFFEIMGHKKASAHHCTHIAKSRRLRTHSAPLQWYSRAFVIAVGRARFISVLLIFAHAHNWRNVFIRYIAACFGSSILRFEFMDFQNATNTKQTSEHKNPHFFSLAVHFLQFVLFFGYGLWNSHLVALMTAGITTWRNRVPFTALTLYVSLKRFIYFVAIIFQEYFRYVRESWLNLMNSRIINLIKKINVYQFIRGRFRYTHHYLPYFGQIISQSISRSRCDWAHSNDTRQLAMCCPGILFIRRFICPIEFRYSYNVETRNNIENDPTAFDFDRKLPSIIVQEDTREKY